MNPKFSVIIPIHNEEGNIIPLHKELTEVLSLLEGGYELIYINDGSIDGSRKELMSLPKAIVIDMNRRFGKATGLTAGFRHSVGEIVITIDGDGQNDPHDIPKLLQHMYDQELDAVSGWRVNRKDRNAIRFITRAGRALRRSFLDDHVSDSGCALKTYRRAAIESLDLQGEMDRYIPALLVWKGFRIGELPVNDRVRVHGKSKYGIDKAVRAFIDLVYLWFLHKYSQRPLHLFGYMGLTSFALSLIALVITLYDRLILGIHLNQDGWFFLTFFFLIMGVMLFSFGLVIELLMRIYYHTSPQERRYHIRSISKKD